MRWAAMLVLVSACAGAESSRPVVATPPPPPASPPPVVVVTPDAAPAPSCGDGRCDETCATCPADCGPCSPGSFGTGGALGTQTSWPCTNCLVTVPSTYDPAVPMPLLVSLHGDERRPGVSHKIWTPATEQNGYILLSPECPRSLGCNGRWGTGDWHPDGPAGSVAWINAQIDAMEAAYNIDRTRIYLVGGSRGAVGFHADAFAPRIAGAAMYAGGYESSTNTCATCAVPVYILVGSRDFLLDIARKARTWFAKCGSEVMFDVVPGVRHQTIGKALKGGKADAILDWFTARPNACATTGSTSDDGA